jgi:NitT/TauT family transport system permease protein
VKSSFTDTASGAVTATDGAGVLSAQAAAAASRRAEARADIARRVRAWIIPVVVVLVILVVWQTLVAVLKLQPYFIPSPLRIASTFKANLRTICDNAVPTLAQAATGFAIGNGLAIIMSIWFVHVSSARRALYPLAIILQSIPLVALAPIAIVTIGNGFATKVVMTAIISFFPTLVNLMRGLASVDTNMLQLFQSVDASRWDVLAKLRWPTALPYLFAGLRITASASMVGAVIVEWIGSDTGLGYMIINSTYQFNTPLLWASVLATSLLVLAVFGLVVVVERLLVPWSRSTNIGA